MAAILRPGSGVVTQGGGQAGAYMGNQNFYEESSQPFSLQRMQNQTDLQRANLANVPARLQQSRFNAIFPWLQGQMGGLMGQFGSQVGGQSPQGPAINAGPIYNPMQTQAMINQQRSFNDMGAATQERQIGNQAASRGLGMSPIVSAMQNNVGMANRAANAQAGTDISMRAAEQNAPHILKGQQAREQQFASRQDEDIRRRQQLMGLFSPLFSAIGGLV